MFSTCPSRSSKMRMPGIGYEQLLIGKYADSIESFDKALSFADGNDRELINKCREAKDKAARS